MRLQGSNQVVLTKIPTAAALKKLLAKTPARTLGNEDTWVHPTMADIRG